MALNVSGELGTAEHNYNLVSFVIVMTHFVIKILDIYTHLKTPSKKVWYNQALIADITSF